MQVKEITAKGKRGRSYIPAAGTSPNFHNSHSYYCERNCHLNPFRPCSMSSKPYFQISYTSSLACPCPSRPYRSCLDPLPRLPGDKEAGPAVRVDGGEKRQSSKEDKWSREIEDEVRVTGGRWRKKQKREKIMPLKFSSTTRNAVISYSPCELSFFHPNLCKYHQSLLILLSCKIPLSKFLP